jgi:hypothetical protein
LLERAMSKAKGYEYVPTSWNGGVVHFVSHQLVTHQHGGLVPGLEPVPVYGFAGLSAYQSTVVTYCGQRGVWCPTIRSAVKGRPLGECKRCLRALGLT